MCRFCYHEKSPCIFPAGFCEKHEIVLTPPKGYDSSDFTWEKYLRNTRSVAAYDSLFHRDAINLGFCTGMKIECADLMDPRLVCVATIAKTVGRLLKIHFDGWEDEYDQWLDSQSPDMYPVGWCVLVGHKLEGPPQVPRPTVPQKISPKSNKKKGRKKKTKADGEYRANTFSLHITLAGRFRDLFPLAATISPPYNLQTKYKWLLSIVVKTPTGRNQNIKKEPNKSEMDETLQLTNNGNGNRTTDFANVEPNADMDENGDVDGDDEEDDDFSHDGYSHSIASGQSRSLPPTPEPRNSTPTMQQNRPSSKTSQLSITSLQSGTTASSLSPKPPSERKVTSYISVNFTSSHSNRFDNTFSPSCSMFYSTELTGHEWQIDTSHHRRNLLNAQQSVTIARHRQRSVSRHMERL